jgi:hypothetical protein
MRRKYHIKERNKRSGVGNNVIIRGDFRAPEDCRHYLHVPAARQSTAVARQVKARQGKAQHGEGQGKARRNRLV